MDSAAASCRRNRRSGRSGSRAACSPLRITAAGIAFVDIATQPGIGPLRGGLDFTFRDDALNARNAFQPTKGPEQTQQYTVNLSGTLLKDRTSFSLSAGGASLYDSANVFAALPDGSRAAPIRRPSDRINLNARLDHALTKSHTLRANYQQNVDDQENLGVGSYDLPDRAYSRNADDSVFRISESGPWGRRWFGDSRLQLHWRSNSSASSVELPTIKVLDAFTAGGAQQAGGRDSDGNRVGYQLRLRARKARRARGIPGRGRLVPQRHPHQLPRHLHVPEPGRLRSRNAGELLDSGRRSAREVHAVAGRPVRAGRLARAQER